MLENIAFLDNRFSVRDIHEKTSTASEPATFAGLKAIHQVTRLCNAAKFDAVTLHKPVEDRTVKGDPTDTALLRFSEALSVPSLGVDTAQLLQSWTKHFEIPFNSRNKWALTVAVPNDEKHENWGWMLVKGGPDVLFSSCSSVLQCDGGSVPFGPNERQRMSAIQNEWSGEGKRVLALWVPRSPDQGKYTSKHMSCSCRKSLDGNKLGLPVNTMEELMYSEMHDLTLVGLVGLRDPPREDVSIAIETIRRAGVRVFMVTGDFKLTAVAIARQVKGPSYSTCDHVFIMYFLLPGWDYLTRAN
jgi:sodium/potassium-transporting ATPase subunit alpha